MLYANRRNTNQLLMRKGSLGSPTNLNSATSNLMDTSQITERVDDLSRIENKTIDVSRVTDISAGDASRRSVKDLGAGSKSSKKIGGGVVRAVSFITKANRSVMGASALDTTSIVSNKGGNSRSAMGGESALDTSEISNIASDINIK